MAASQIQSYRDLDASRIAMDLSVLVYQAVKTLLDSERFALSVQVRRASVSVPSNIAEGQACGEDGRYIHHLRVALGSLGELSTQVEIAHRLGLMPVEITAELEDSMARTGEVVHGLLRSRLKKRRLAAAAGSALLGCLGWWLLGFPTFG